MPHLDSPLMQGSALRARIDDLAAISAEPGWLTRVFASPEHRRANDLVLGWMRAAGMAAREDAIGNVVGRYEGRVIGARALLIGSHIDTVRNAGKYDGAFGVVAGIAAVAGLHAAGERLDFAIEVIAFGDEEGVRFPTTLTGSRAFAGLFARSSLDQKDAEGVSMREALTNFGCEPEAVAKLRGRNVAAFVELHIEQGPVLEAENLPVGVVTAINGATRFHCTLRGLAGHAGATPMNLRKDALAAAAEMILMVEARAREEEDLVATVGRLEVEPGAVNVIPGEARFTIDMRAPRDAQRQRAVNDIDKRLIAIAKARGVALISVHTHEAAAYICDPGIVAGLEAAVESIGQPARLLPSGAGHDTMIMGALCPAGMLFVRCKGGISHNPLESITVEDCEIGLAALMAFVRGFKAA